MAGKGEMRGERGKGRDSVVERREMLGKASQCKTSCEPDQTGNTTTPSHFIVSPHEQNLASPKVPTSHGRSISQPREAQEPRPSRLPPTRSAAEGSAVPSPTVPLAPHTPSSPQRLQMYVASLPHKGLATQAHNLDRVTNSCMPWQLRMSKTTILTGSTITHPTLTHTHTHTTRS